MPSGGSLRVWDDFAPNGSALRVLNFQSLRSVRFTPDGRKLLLSGWVDHIWPHVILAGRETGDPEFLLPVPRCGFWDCERTPDGRLLLLITGDTQEEMQGRFSCRALEAPTVPLWSGQTPAYLYTRPLILADGARFVLFEWLPSRDSVALVTRDLATGAVVAESRQPDRYHDPVASHDGRWIAARDGNRALVYHGENFAGRPILLQNDNRKEFTGLAFHPSGRYLAATSNDATVKLYDTTTWTVAKVFTWEIGRLRSVAFSPDGMLAAAGSDRGKVIVWDFDL
jgi:hypothetical protein